jgi:N-acetylneuraminate synthase/sialic acid synthase
VPRELVIGGRVINDDAPCYVIAEIGNNHGGSVVTAQQMAAAAASAGASAVKFQCRHNATLYTSALRARPYQHAHSFGPTYGAHRDALELSERDLQNVFATSQVTAFATAFDEASADLLMRLKAPAIKLASGSLTDAPLLTHVRSLGVPLILSTGGGTRHDIDHAVDILLAGTARFAVLHCTAAYPVLDYAELNLRAIQTLRERYPQTVIGWSGHVSGIAMSVMAYTLGARIIEQHFTTNRALKGTDHAFSLEPAGLRKLVRDLTRAKDAMGDGIKRVYPSEVAPIAKMRRTQTPEGWKIAG